MKLANIILESKSLYKIDVLISLIDIEKSINCEVLITNFAMTTFVSKNFAITNFVITLHFRSYRRCN